MSIESKEMPASAPAAPGLGWLQTAPHQPDTAPSSCSVQAAMHGCWMRLLDAPAAAFLLWLGLRWGLMQSLRIRLLAMLHLGFVWLGIAYALYAANGLSAVAGARGHSGRSLSADGKPG